MVLSCKKVITWLVLAISLGIVLLAILVPVAMTRFGHARIQAPNEVPAGVVIIFGAGLKRNGEPSDVLADRLRIGADLYRRGLATHILVSGDNSFEDYNEPRAMYDRLVDDYSIPPEVIALDLAGRRTYDTCIRARQLWQVQKAILVTQEFHLPRAIWTCEQLGIESVGVSATLESYVDDEAYSLREVLAMYKAFIDVYLWPPAYIDGPVEADWSQDGAE